MNKKLIRWDFWTGVTLLAIVVFGLFLIYPLFSLFITAFQDSETGAFTLGHFTQFFERKYYYQSMINSFSVTTCVTVLAIVIGTILAYFMSMYKIRGKNMLEIGIIISLLSPPFIGAYSWILLGGRSGVLTRWLESMGIEAPSIYGFSGILLVLTLKLYPFIYLYVSGALKNIDAALIEAAESLGCSGIRKVFTVIVPLITPTILAGALMVFMNAMADFGTPMLIGEGFNVMPVMIYSEFINEVGDQANFAAAMAAIMVFITSVIFLLQKYVVNRKSFTMSSLRPIQVGALHGIQNVLVHVGIYLLVALSLIPQLVVIYTSFLETRGAIFVDGYSLESYRTIFHNLGSAIQNTYIFSTSAIVLIVFLGMTVAYLTTRRKSWLTEIIDTLTMFPYIIPGSVLGITLLLAFNDEPLLLSGTAFIIIISLVIRRLPYTLRSSSAILYQISPSLEEASISLGASPLGDIFWGGSLNTMKPKADLFENYTSANEEHVQEAFKNTEGPLTRFTDIPSVIMVNTNLAGDIPIEGYEDLLNPALKGKIAFADPSKSSSSYEHLVNMLYSMGKGNPEAGWDYVEQLCRNLDGKLLSGSSAVYKGVADGEYTVGLTFEEGGARYVADGAPVKLVYMKEGVISKPDGIYIIKNAKHMENAKKFIDFITSKEAQTLITQQLHRRSVRDDVPAPNGLQDKATINIIQDDENVVNQSKKAWLDKFKDIFTSVQ